MQAITTKILPPTDTKGQRIKASAAAGTLTLSWEYGVGVEANHRQAARAFCDKMGWPFMLASGTDAKGNGQHVPLSDNMAEYRNDNTGAETIIRKYRPAELADLYTGWTEASERARLQISRDGHKTKHLALGRWELKALLALFNQNDDE